MSSITVVDKYGVLHKFNKDMCNKCGVEVLSTLSHVLTSLTFSIANSDMLLNTLWEKDKWVVEKIYLSNQSQSCTIEDGYLTQPNIKALAVEE